MAILSCAAMPWTSALGQGTPAVTEVVPVSSPSASPSAAPEASPAPAPMAASPSPAGSPAASGTAPDVSGTAAVSGSAPAMSGTEAAVSGTAPLTTGTSAEATPSPTPSILYSIEIDLGKQRVFLLKEGKEVAEAPVSSGRPGHLTPTGNFEVIQKDLNHFSNLYGKIVEKKSGALVKAGADVAMPVPKGCIFVPAPMKWFMRFDGAAGMHAGILPGYAASHGCVRMPAAKAELFYNTIVVGTPVHVFGTPPEHASHEEHEEAHHHDEGPVMAKLAPAPTPKKKSGWWPF